MTYEKFMKWFVEITNEQYGGNMILSSCAVEHNDVFGLDMVN